MNIEDYSLTVCFKERVQPLTDDFIFDAFNFRYEVLLNSCNMLDIECVSLNKRSVLEIYVVSCERLSSESVYFKKEKPLTWADIKPNVLNLLKTAFKSIGSKIDILNKECEFIQSLMETLQ